MKYALPITALLLLCGLNAQASPVDSSSKVAAISMGECSSKDLDAVLGGTTIWIMKEDTIQWNPASRECLNIAHKTQEPQIPGSPYPTNNTYSLGAMSKDQCCAKAQYICPGIITCSHSE